MNLSAFVLEASEQDYKAAFDAHPVFLALKNGTFSRKAYLAYLRETFHLIRHTTSTFARAVSHVPETHRSFRGWLLDQAVDALITKPSADTLNAARAAWKAARPPYQQTEVYRFGNPIVDDWEGRVNSWPLDEGLIDYVDAGKYGSESDENTLYTANVIANTSIEINGEKVDASKITPEFLSGTLPYMAPEQALGKRFDARVDLYALGVIAYEWLTGRRPLELRGEFRWVD